MKPGDKSMDQERTEIAESLRSCSFEINRALKQMDAAGAEIAASWECEAADDFRNKLGLVISLTDHSGRMIDNIAAQLMQRE